MTAEKRVAIEISDVAGIEFECLRCKGRCYIPLKKFSDLMTNCPNCRDVWFKVQSQGNPEQALVYDFLDHFKRLAELVAPLNVKVRMQISEEAIDGRERETTRAKTGTD